MRQVPDSVEETHDRIARGEVVYPEGSTVSPDARSFIEALLQKDPKARMTVDEVLSHPFVLSAA